MILGSRVGRLVLAKRAQLPVKVVFRIRCSPKVELSVERRVRYSKNNQKV
jgi:hypothetical protein